MENSQKDTLIKTDKSSRILIISYKFASKSLKITFKSGATYEYYDVPKEVVDGLSKADSLGKYFDNNIKGVYNYRRVING